MPEIHEAFCHDHDHFYRHCTGVPDAIAPNSSIAATVWGNDIRVYFQDTEGWVREACWSGSEWYGGAIEHRLVKAKPYTPLAVVSLNSPDIRLYYVSENNQLREHSHGNGWGEGSLNHVNVYVHPVSKLAATRFWEYGQLQIRLYYQNADDQCIHEWIFKENCWLQGPVLSHAKNGSALAACSWGNGSIRVYYQSDCGKFNEAYWNHGESSSWNTGAFSVRGFPDSQIACAALDADRIRVYFQGQNQCIIEATSESEWQETMLSRGLAHTRLAVVHWPENPCDQYQMKLFYQPSKSALEDSSMQAGGSFMTRGMLPTGQPMY